MPNIVLEIAEAVRRFNELPREKQAAMRWAQRKSWVIGELMLGHPEMTREQAERIYDRVVF